MTMTTSQDTESSRDAAAAAAALGDDRDGDHPPVTEAAIAVPPSSGAPVDQVGGDAGDHGAIPPVAAEAAAGVDNNSNTSLIPSRLSWVPGPPPDALAMVRRNTAPSPGLRHVKATASDYSSEPATRRKTFDQRLMMKILHDDTTTALQDDSTEVDELSDDSNVNVTSSIYKKSDGDHPSKQRPSAVGSEIGAMQVDGQAPQLNRRFYLGLDRASVLARNSRERPRRRREGGSHDTANGDSPSGSGWAHVLDLSGSRESSKSGQGNTVQHLSTMTARVSALGEVLISATLVEDDDREVVIAQHVRFFERKWKIIASIMCLSLVILAVCLSVFIDKANEVFIPTVTPSAQPSSSPSLDPRPTLQVVQTRGHVRCGLSNSKYHEDFCRAVAAVLFGNPDQIDPVIVTGSNRFQMLHGRSVDLLLYSDTHTIEREVREKTTGSGFVFSSLYAYEGMAYYGNATFVKCAEEAKRFNECSSLRICTNLGSTFHAFLQTSFPSDFIEVCPLYWEMEEMLLNGTCNVMVSFRSRLIQMAEDNPGRNFVVGDKLMTKEASAAVTRNDDSEFSDIINWVVQALFYGEEQGLMQNSSHCDTYTDLTGNVADLDFLNAVYCVGNFIEIHRGDKNNRGWNQINNGTTGMLYTIPFGELDREIDLEDISFNTTSLDNIRDNGTLNCGIIIPDGHADGEGTSRDKVAEMGIDYCRAVAAAFFNGNYERVNLWNFSEYDDDSYLALNNGTIDVLSGVRVEQKHDFGSSPSLGGLHFSMPYYYGNETESEDVSFFSLATRDADKLFASFVNCVVLATIYAEENDIKKSESKEMPLVTLFGSEFTWVLRDAIGYSGSYGQIYEKHFGYDASKGMRGRNDLNDGGPQIHSFPGFKD